MKKELLLFCLIIFSQFSFAQSKVVNPILDLGNDTTICNGYVILLDAGSGFDSYLWQDGSNAQTYLATEAGVYWVQVLIGSAVYADTIEINHWPYPDPDLGNDIILCFGESAVLEPQGNYLTYTWQDGSNLPFYVIVEPGVYWVTVMDVHGCGGSDTIMVDFATPVYLGPDTVICECGSVLLDAGDQFISYLWWQDGSTSQYFSVDGEEFGVGNHNIYVTVVDSNNCESTDDIEVYINEHVKVNQTENNILKLYPNPCKDIVIVDIKDLPIEGYTIEIFDLFGRVVYVENIIATNFQYEIRLDVSNFNSGFYNLLLSSRTIKIQRKLMIQKR